MGDSVATFSDVLGDHSVPVAKFFYEILELSSDESPNLNKDVIVAFATRRCNVLSRVFCNIASDIQENPELLHVQIGENEALSQIFGQCINLDIRQIEKSHFMSDMALIAMAGKLYEYYIEKGFFPAIYIVDDIVIHGRTLNHILLRLEKCLLQHSICAGDDVEPLPRAHKIEKAKIMLNALQRSIHIRTFAENKNMCLIYQRYQSKLKSVERYDPKDLRELSQRLSVLTAYAHTNNTAYAWSLKIPSGELAYEELWDPLSLRSAGEFRRRDTRVQTIEERNYIYRYSGHSASNPKLVCSLRMQVVSHNNEAPVLQIVPFVFAGKLPVEGLPRLVERLGDILGETDFWGLFVSDNFGVLESSEYPHYYRWFSERLNLLLGVYIINRFRREYSHMSWAGYHLGDYVDYDFMMRSYIDGFAYLGNYDMRRSQLEALWNWVPEDPTIWTEIIELIVEDMEPVLFTEQFSSLEIEPEIIVRGINDFGYVNANTIKRKVEHAAIKLARISERNAYEKMTSSIMFDQETLANWGSTHNLNDIVEMVMKNRNKNEDLPDLDSVLAHIIHFMDLGIIGVSPAICQMNQSITDVDDSECGETVYSMIRAGEQSSALEPLRFAPLLGALAVLKEYVEDNEIALNQSIEYFVSKLVRFGIVAETDYEPAISLIRGFFEQMECMGQQPRDWLYPFHEDLISTGEDDRTWRDLLDDQRKFLAIYYFK